MAKKKKDDALQALLQGIKATISTSIEKDAPKGQNNGPYIPSIMEFVESPKYLDMPSHGINPFPMQRIVLKAFYYGTPGNTGPESALTEEELKLCREHGLDGDENGNVIDKLKAGKTFRELALVCGRRCVSGDTLITDPETGRRWKIADLWRQEKLISSWTLNERTGQMTLVPTCGAIHQGKRPVKKLTLLGGLDIEATDNHPLLTQRGWVELGKLDVDKDKVAVVTEEPFFGKSTAISEAEAALLGYITGDGCCSQKSVFFTCSNEEVRKDFVRCLAALDSNLELFTDPWTGAKSKQYQFKVRQKEKKSESYWHEGMQRTASRPAKNSLQKLLIKHDLMGKRCHHKCVPEALFECPKNVMAAYLRALFSCDRSLNLKKGPRQVEFEFVTVNPEQAKLVQHLLLRFGIVASVRRKVSSTHIAIEGKSYPNHLSYRVSFSRKRYIERLIRDLWFVGREVLLENTRKKLSDIRVHEEDEPYLFRDILRIEDAGEQETYDLQVSSEESLQNYTAQGVVSHNSGKDFLASFIALYEAMRLIECPGGDPYAVYNLPRGGNDIAILTIANSAKQAMIAFAEMKAKIMQSPYFEGKFVKDGVTQSSIYLMTKKDVEEREDMIRRGLEPKHGSIVIQAGHSNSDSLLGMQVFVLILDEVASFKNTGGSSGGKRIYEAMLPALNTFVRPLKDENGNVVLDDKGKPKTVTDSKCISISSPRGREGILWEMFRDAPTAPARLAVRQPTWVMNLKFNRDDLRGEFNMFNDDRFMMEFGAEFSITAGMNFFAEDRLKPIFHPDRRLVDFGSPGNVYFLHIDPSTNSANYTMVIVHKEMRVNQTSRTADPFVIVDHIKSWRPTKEKPIIADEIERYILRLNQCFHIGMATIDAGFSDSIITRMRKLSIPCRMTPYNQRHKNVIYNDLEKLVNENKIIIPDDGLECLNLKNEMKNLQRRYPTGSRLYSIHPNKESDTPTDDTVDSLAGAVHSAMSTQESRLPRSVVISMPLTQSRATPFRGPGPVGTPGMGSISGIPGLDAIRARNGHGGGGGMGGFGTSPTPRIGY